MFKIPLLGQLALLFPTLVFVVIATWISLKHTPDFNKNNNVNSACMITALILTGVMFLLFGSSYNLLKGILLVVLFIYASVYDYKVREVPDCASVMVLLIGILNISASTLFIRAVECLIVFAFLLFSASLKKSHFGGGDIKFASACIMLTGIMGGIDALIIGLVLAVVCTLIRNKKENIKDKSLPLVPYLSIGFLTIIIIGGF